ncbi:hypothetical protein RHGRI_011562 [Rhododendron griersonianum]|uniref:Uncharacterized protein n=1 Tax=Rhododendron griersonianum TaxID=479676 RepID=A0AAV6KMM3_9ERIC|nr:hypothetical protein RHGRI_011562 [Rhododendron griersonianum]
MANLEESSPLLSTHLPSDDDKIPTKPTSVPPPAATSTKQSPPDGPAYGWTADGLPLGHGSVVGEPMRRAQWDSSLLDCLGPSDEFCCSDLEVCEFLFRVLFSSYFPIFVLVSWSFIVVLKRVNFKNLTLNVDGEAARHLTGHVDAVVALLRMMCSVSIANLFATLQPTSSATSARFARRAVSSTVGFLILGLRHNLSWSWSRPETKPWAVARPESESCTSALTW